MFVVFAFFKKLFSIFTSDAAKKVYARIDAFVPIVLPIVASLLKVDPKSATYAQIQAVYTEYGEVVGSIKESPESFGNALLNLATRIVKKKYPNAPASEIQTAIQLALVSLRSK